MSIVVKRINEQLRNLRKMQEASPVRAGLNSLISTLESAKARIDHLEKTVSPEGQVYTAASVNLLAAVVAGNPGMTTAEQIEKAVDLADQFFNGVAQ